MADPAAAAPGLPERPLSIQGQLTLRSDGHAFKVRGEGKRIVIEASDLTALKSLLSQRPSNDQAGGLNQFLRRADLDVQIICRGQPIARLGPAAEPGWLEKMFQIKGVDVSARGLIKSLFSKRPEDARSNPQ